MTAAPDTHTLRAALDAVAEICGAPAGSHPDNVIRVVRDMRSDPQRHNADRVRALYIVGRLVAAVADLTRDSTDPGAEAMGALWEGREFLRVGGASRKPLPADVDPDRLEGEIREALHDAADDELATEEEAAAVLAVVLRHVRRAGGEAP